MSVRKKPFWIAISILTLIVLQMELAISQENQIIVGTINDQGQIVVLDGDAYELADTDMGRELALLHGKTVLVTGKIIEENRRNIIAVEYYEVDTEETEESNEKRGRRIH